MDRIVFIGLTQEIQQRPKIRINVKHIVAYGYRPDGSVSVTLDTGDYVVVEETPEAIDALINEGINLCG